jgi:ABC-type multidrug transport system fused ATPase/permease subunit
MGQDLLQLINNGVPIIDMLASSMGVATSEVKDLVSQGAVTFPVLVKAFQDATAEGGKFAGGMEQQSNAIFGLFSTLRDNMTMALAEIGKSIAENLNLKENVKALTLYVQTLTERFKALTPEAQKKIIAIAALVAGIGPLLILIGQMSIGLSALAGAFAFIVSPIGLVIAAVGALAAAFIYIADNWAAVKERVSDWSWWNNMLIDMIQFVLNNNPFAIVLDLYNDFAGTLGLATLPNPFESMSGFLEGLRMETKQYENEFGTFSEAVVNGAKRAGEALGFLQSKSQAITPPSTEDANAIVSSAAGAATGGAGASGPTIPPIADEVINEMDLIYEAMGTLPTVVETIGEGVKLSAQTATGAIAQIASAMRGLAGDSKALALFEIAANTARGIAAAVAAGAGVPFPGNIGAIASGIATVLGGIGQAKAALSSVPAFAQGGMVTGPTLAMVGDNASGKEAIIPFEKMGQFMGMMGGSNVNVNITGEFDGDALRLVLDKSNQELNSIR